MYKRQILNIDNGYNFIESIVCAAGAGIGFLVAMVLFSGVRRRVAVSYTHLDVYKRQ